MLSNDQTAIRQQAHFVCTKVHLRHFEGKWRVDWFGAVKGKRVVVCDLAVRGDHLNLAFTWCRHRNAEHK